MGKRKRGLEIRIECVNGVIPAGAVEAALAAGPVDCLLFDFVSHDAADLADLAQTEAEIAQIERDTAETIAITQRLEEEIAQTEAETAQIEQETAEIVARTRKMEEETARHDAEYEAQVAAAKVLIAEKINRHFLTAWAAANGAFQ